MSVIDPRRHSRLDAPEALLASEYTPANSERSIESDLCFEIIDRIARRIAPIHGTLVASHEYVRQRGAPKNDRPTPRASMFRARHRDVTLR